MTRGEKVAATLAIIGALIGGIAFGIVAANASDLLPRVPLPPAEYDRPYDGRLTILTVPAKDVRILCRDRFAMACAFVDPGRCRVILPREARGVFLDRLRRHEIGHCNGWSNDHLGGRFVP